MSIIKILKVLKAVLLNTEFMNCLTDKLFNCARQMNNNLGSECNNSACKIL